MNETISPIWERELSSSEETEAKKTGSNFDSTKIDFQYKICYKIAFTEYFKKIEDSEDEIYICRKHNWIEGNVGYEYYPQCPICSECVEERTEELIVYNKHPNFKELYAKPGTYQTLVDKDELEEFLDYMEELYPFPEEFI